MRLASACARFRSLRRISWRRREADSRLDGSCIIGKAFVNKVPQIGGDVLDTWRRSIQCALGLLAVSALLPAQTVLFIPQPDVVVAGLNPASLAIGDFNGHRRADLAVANRGAATVAVWLGLG